jgi:hypothetical protein
MKGSAVLDVLDGSAPSSPYDYANLVDDLEVALAATVAHLPQRLREEQLMHFEHGTLRADVEKFVLKLHHSPYPRIVGGGGVQ